MPDIEVTALSWVPPLARGLVRDLRIRWVLEELGRPYRTRLFDRRTSGPEERQPEQPFGQVPAFREGNVHMFESGAVCLWLAERAESDVLLPRGEAARARAMSWCFAALNSVEPYIHMVQCATLFDADKPGAAEFAPATEERLHARLVQLGDALGDRPWLEDRFTVADLLMVCVLRQLSRSGRLGSHPRLASYVERGEDRPAFHRALAAQLADFVDDKEANT